MSTDAVRAALAELVAATNPDVETSVADWRKAWAAARAALSVEPAPSGRTVPVARPLEWEREGSFDQWTDKRHGFSIMLDDDDDEPYAAAWGEDDSATFATLQEAQAWCQDQIDDWVSRHVLLAAAPSPTPQEPTP